MMTPLASWRFGTVVGGASLQATAESGGGGSVQCRVETLEDRFLLAAGDSTIVWQAVPIPNTPAVVEESALAGMDFQPDAATTDADESRSATSRSPPARTSHCRSDPTQRSLTKRLRPSPPCSRPRPCPKVRIRLFLAV